MADSWSCSVFVRLPIRTLLPKVTSLMSQCVVSFSARQMVYHVASSTCSYSSSIMFEKWSFVPLGPELKTETRMAMARLSKGWRIRGTQSSISYERKRIGRSNFSDKQRPLRRIKLHWCGAFCLFVSNFETNFFSIIFRAICLTFSCVQFWTWIWNENVLLRAFCLVL